MIPGNLDGAGGVFVDSGLQPFGDFPATFAAPAPYDRCARIVIDGPQAVPLRRVTQRGTHDLLPVWAPHGVQRGHPTHVEGVGIVAHVSCAQVVAGRFERLCVT
jgi:hypothetical protein